MGAESHSGFHLFERMLVAADFLVGRNESMSCIMGSGNALILSSVSSVGIDCDIFKIRVLNKIENDSEKG